MKILHLDGFTKEEKLSYLPIIISNTLDSIFSLVDNSYKLEIPFVNEENNEKAKTFLHLYDCRNSPSTHATLMESVSLIKSLWNDPARKAVLRRSNEFRLLDSAQYFIDNVERNFAPNYIPNEQDILRSRCATLGIVETSFWLDNANFKFFDVGGQRGERKKWVHCFDEVTSIMYVASLSEFNQTLYEDPTRNRLLESLQLFQNIINLPWFVTTPIILFLNKQDLFAEKIKQIDLHEYFDNYDGRPFNFEDGVAFFQEAYFIRNQNPEKVIYCHVTDATDTENIGFVWKAVKHIILTESLRRSDMMM